MKYLEIIKLKFQVSENHWQIHKITDLIITQLGNKYIIAFIIKDTMKKFSWQTVHKDILKQCFDTGKTVIVFHHQIN